jgi:CysZ protein
MEELGLSEPQRVIGGRADSIGSVRGTVVGFRTLLAGVGMLMRERSLWALAAVPVGLALVLLLGAAMLIFEYAPWIHDFLTAWMPALEAGAWYTWIWIGPAKLLAALVGYLLFGLFSAIAVLLSLLVANLLSAPFLDVLSQRVERIELGGVRESGESGLRAIWSEARRSLSNELQRLLFFVAVWGLIALGGVLIPGAQLVAPFLLLAFTAIFLPLDYAGYALDRRHVSFSRRRSWVRAHLGMMVGFGCGAIATSLVPGLNFLLLPSLVVGGTLLALRNPVEDGRDPD